MSWIRYRLFVSALALSTVGCVARVPPEAVELSEVASRRTVAFQSSHEAAVRAYFQLSRDRVEDFLRDRWVPHFLETYVRDANLMRDLTQPVVLTPAQQERVREELVRLTSVRDPELARTVVAVNSGLADGERGKMVLEFAEAALAEIGKQRRELIAPIDRLEHQTIAQIRHSYGEMLQIQSALTAYVRSVQKAQAAEDAVLRRLGAMEARDAAVLHAIGVSDEVAALAQSAGRADEVLEKIRSALRNREAPDGSTH